MTTSCERRFTISWGAFGLCLALTVPASAAPLDKAACAKLSQDMQNMKALDVDKLMEKGPSWAVSHLAPADLGLIRQYIDLDEQLKFRCSAPSSLVHLKHIEEDEEDGAPKASAATDKSPEDEQGAKAGDGEAQDRTKPKAKAASKPKAAIKN